MKKFETIKTGFYPDLKDSRGCPVCGSDLKRGQYIINVGGFSTERVLGLFSIARHFHDGDDCYINIINDQEQVDLEFCSKKCIIKFFENVLKRLK